MEKPRLTSYADLIKKTKTTIVETRLGNVFEIKILQPGDFLSVIGTPITQRLFFDSSGKFGPPDMANEAEAVKTVSELMEDEEFMANAKEMVCRGVVSLNFVNKPQDECDSEKQELSVELLDFNDIMDLLSFMITASSDDREVKDFYSFRGITGEEQGIGNQDTPVSEGI